MKIEENGASGVHRLSGRERAKTQQHEKALDQNPINPVVITRISNGPTISLGGFSGFIRSLCLPFSRWLAAPSRFLHVNFQRSFDFSAPVQLNTLVRSGIRRSNVQINTAAPEGGAFYTPGLLLDFPGLAFVDNFWNFHIPLAECNDQAPRVAGIQSFLRALSSLAQQLLTDKRAEFPRSQNPKRFADPKGRNAK